MTVRLPLDSADWMLWVIIMVVRRFFWMIWLVMAMTFSAVAGSNAAVCSSSKSSLGGTMVLISSVSGLPLPTGQKAHFSIHPVLQSHIKLGQGRPEKIPVAAADRQAKAPGADCGNKKEPDFLQWSYEARSLSWGPETGARSLAARLCSGS